jgi:hypothetical protein
MTKGNTMARATRKNIPMKMCTRTGIEYPATIDNFYRDKTQKDGLSSWSKNAEREYNALYYATLKKLGVTRKNDIADEKVRAQFDRAMRAVRVARKANVNANS